MGRRTIVVFVLVALTVAVAWVARFSYSGLTPAHDDNGRPPVRGEPKPEPEEPIEHGNDITLPAQNATERGQLIDYALEKDGRVGFFPVAAFMKDPDGVRWYAPGEDLPDGNVTGLAAPVKGADKWLEGVDALPPFPVLSVRWADVTDAGLAHVAGLGAVVALRVSGSKTVTDEGARHLRALTGLRLLDLGATKLTDGGLVYLRDLKQLEVLRLYATATGDAGLEHLRGLTRLEALDAGMEMTVAGIARQLRDAPLKRLDLGGLRDVKTLAPLAVFSGLERLDLAHTGIGDAALATLHTLSGLTELDLSHTAVTDQGLAALAEMRGLRRLDLSGLPVTDKGVRSVGACVRLRELSLAFTKVDNDGLARLKSLGVLEVLDLSGTPTNDQGLVHLAGLKHLRELHLPAGATAAAATTLEKLPALRKLFVDKSMKPGPRTELEDALPLCRIE